MKNSVNTVRKERSETPTVRWLKTPINKLTPTDSKQVFRVTEKTGLRVEITPNRKDSKGSQIQGRKTIRYVVKFNEKPLYITLKHFEKDDEGKFLRWTNQMFWGENVFEVDTVEESLAVIQELLRKGINPNESAQLRKDSATVEDLFARYCRYFEERIKTGERRSKSYEDILGMWKNHIQPHLASKRAAEITDQFASEYMTALLSRSSYAVHNKVLRMLKALYNYGIQTAKILNENPFLGIKRLEEVKRDRHLSLDEFNRLRESLTHEKQIYQDIVLVLALTGQRKHCVLSMEWREINAEKGVWSIPRSKVKSKRPHTVPLSPAVMAILSRRSHEAVQGERFVFPSANSASGHVVEKSGAGSFWRRIIKRAGLYDEDGAETLRIHDLRRSLASFSVERGASIQAVSKLLGHSDISITAASYAHLSVDAVRGELVQTESMMLMDPSTKKLEILRDQILALPVDDRLRLMAMIQEVEG